MQAMAVAPIKDGKRGEDDMRKCYRLRRNKFWWWVRYTHRFTKS